MKIKPHTASCDGGFVQNSFKIRSTARFAAENNQNMAKSCLKIRSKFVQLPALLLKTIKTGQNHASKFVQNSFRASGSDLDSFELWSTTSLDLVAKQSTNKHILLHLAAIRTGQPLMQHNTGSHDYCRLKSLHHRTNVCTRHNGLLCCCLRCTRSAAVVVFTLPQQDSCADTVALY